MAPLVFLICYPSQILILLPGWTPLCSERYCAHRNGFTGKKYKELQGINYNYWHQLYITHYSSPPHQASSDPCRGWHAASTDQPMTITYYVLWLQLNNIELGFWFPFYLLKTASFFSFSRKYLLKLKLSWKLSGSKSPLHATDMGFEKINLNWLHELSVSFKWKTTNWYLYIIYIMKVGSTAGKDNVSDII